MTQSKKHRLEAMQHPSALYQSPEDVWADNNLSSKTKMDVLNNWADSIQQKLEATAENMPPAKSNVHDEELLQRINSCIEQHRESNKDA